jgi:uncharacterized protein YndB with AHSA1/START domain
MAAKKVFTEIEIAATQDQVWSVLTDFDKIPEWSNSFQGLKGDFRDGGQATAYFKSPMGNKIMEFQHTLTYFKDGESFGWSDPFMLGMKDNHKYQLKTLDNGNTLFTQTDVLKGGASFLVGGIMASSMKKAYNEFNQQLKERVETIYAD